MLRLLLLLLSPITFVPAADVVNTFKILCEQDELPPKAQSDIDYFEDTRIESMRRTVSFAYIFLRSMELL